MKSSVIEDHKEKTKTITRYDYDALGRRTLVQDEGSTLMRTLYDGMSFDIIREQESFADGYFTNTSDTYVDWQTSGGESASRYRYIGEEAGSQGQNSGQAGSQRPNSGQANSSGSNSGNFRANSNADYRLVSPNRSRSSVTLFAKGEAVATNKNSYSTSTTSTSTGNRSGTTSASTKRSYFGTDMIGSVRSATHDDGLNANYYDYDVFGKPFGETSDYGYVGKPYDPVTGLYNYGYRDYSPKTARFTTVDPIRDGHNWYAYCSNDPVNFVDLWGLSASDGKAISTAVLILREQSGYGNLYDSTRYIFKTYDDGTMTVFQDNCGANCMNAEFAKKHDGMTLPDGVYYLTTDSKSLTKQEDGTYDSPSYKNTVLLQTDDPNIDSETRDSINSGTYLLHADQRKNDETPFTQGPQSAGCPTSQGGQENHDTFMSEMYKGGTQPEDVRVVIRTLISWE